MPMLLNWGSPGGVDIVYNPERQACSSVVVDFVAFDLYISPSNLAKLTSWFNFQGENSEWMKARNFDILSATTTVHHNCHLYYFHRTMSTHSMTLYHSPVACCCLSRCLITIFSLP
ncbi:hypothetical protein CsSME_00000603 [Camellia sinensis var. sinensis]